MERDGAGEAPESRPGDEPETPEWTIEDFDTFAPFEGDVSEDDVRRGENDLQGLTNTFVERIDQLLAHKEAELLEV